MERRFVLFLVLAFGILMANAYVSSILYPKPAQEQAAAEAKKKAEAAKPPLIEKREPAAPGVAKPEASKPQPPMIEEKKPAAAEGQGPQPVPPEKPLPVQWVTLGSADPADPYRMLVTLSNQGAAVVRVELSSPRYRALTDADGFLADRSGYLGHVVVDATIRGKGCPVQVVGPGTPAAKAGLQPGDWITSLAGRPVMGVRSLEAALAKTRPGKKVKLDILRDGKSRTLEATLGHRPMEVIRPEGDDPLSFLLTLSEIDGQRLDEPEDAKDASEQQGKPAEKVEKLLAKLDRELPGVNLRRGVWQIDSASQEQVTFRRMLPKWGLEIIKTYRLAKVPAEAIADPFVRAYHLVFELGIRNVASQPRTVAYQLDGPNGLPIEGWWYASKVGRVSGAGLRDVVVSFDHSIPKMVGCPQIAQGNLGTPWEGQSVTYIGVDAQYFSAILIPQQTNSTDVWIAESQPLLVGPVRENQKNLANTSCRVVSKAGELQPGGVLAHRFEIFLGPKNTQILAGYGLNELVYYGWFSWAAKPMVRTLHFFHYFVGSYGFAIIMLTVLVRLCMYPLSRKQAINAQKMQELQPEMKKLQEKYKKDLEARTKAQQELFRKHNYSPLSGCLPMFIQLPIFIALYRSLMVDIELRQAPLLTDSIRWCSDLSAPDMLLNWVGFMPKFVTEGIGFFGLGPYFNVLPILTVLLFLWQQKMFMPPPTDEQQAMQQKVMSYMMLFMGILFYKVASGLCLYFIATSLWSAAERKLLPKTAQGPSASDAAAAKSPRDGGSDGLPAGRSKKKSGGRR